MDGEETEEHKKQILNTLIERQTSLDRRIKQQIDKQAVERNGYQYNLATY